MGIWSCLGTDLDTVRDALYNGKSGIGLHKERLDYGYRSGLTGIVPEPEITTVAPLNDLPAAFSISSVK